MKKFKIGDTVERIRWNHGQYKIGDQGKIVSIEDVFGQMRFCLENDSEHDLHHPENLKLVKSAEPEIINNYEIY